MKKMNGRRNKEETKRKLTDAVGAIILRDGFSAIGVNAVAREAGVDKVLIYRYFDDLEGLLKSYVLQKDYFSNIAATLSKSAAIETRGEAVSLAKKIFFGQLQDILSNRELQEIILWELNSKNEVSAAMAKEREAQGIALLRRISKTTGKTKVDVPAAAALILGGIYFLVLRSRQVDVFNGIHINSKKGWTRIERAVEDLVGLVLADPAKPPLE